jgi:hypothetical protein
MSKALENVKLSEGTLVRHKVSGYEGRIDGITEIRSCFTVGGVLSDKSTSKETYQYRVLVAGESMRRIAPAADLEILEGVVDIICSGCGYSFHSKPGLGDKPGGRCQCGGWICPACLACQGTQDGTDSGRIPVCTKQRSRQTRKLAGQKKTRVVDTKR